jgi:integrase
VNIDLKSPLANGITAFLRHKRALGKRLEKPELIFRMLDRFLVGHAVADIHGITPTVVDDFIHSTNRHSPRSYNVLLSGLRGLFDWLVRNDMIATSPLRIPPQRVTSRRIPFLFTTDQASRLLAAASRLKDNSNAARRGEIYRMIFLLLYALGLRVGEVSRLRRKDVDLDRRLLVIRQTKFGKHRLVPFGPKIMREITDFLERRGASAPIPLEFPLFSFSQNGQRPVGTSTISWTFHKLIPELDLTVPEGVTPPHPHCLRHSFAVGTLLCWYRTGVDPATRLLDLSTFLGHVSPSSTSVYLTITAELLECANQRFAHFATPACKELAL